MSRTLATALLLAATACGASESKFDVYMQGMQVEGAAERGPCKMTFDGGTRAQVLSGDQVQKCLEEQEKALALYEKARKMGMDEDVEFVATYEKAQERKANLESMLKQIRRMERD